MNVKPTEKSRLISRLFRLLIGVFLSAFLMSCATVTQSERAYVVAHEREYLDAANEYLEYGRSGNVGGMLRMTSPETIRNLGRDYILRVIRDRKIALLRNHSATLYGIHSIDVDNLNALQATFRGRINGQPPQPLYIVVEKEEGRYVVTFMDTYSPHW